MRANLAITLLFTLVSVAEAQTQRQVPHQVPNAQWKLTNKVMFDYLSDGYELKSVDTGRLYLQKGPSLLRCWNDTLAKPPNFKCYELVRPFVQQQ
jgi:hypothetical protein